MPTELAAQLVAVDSVNPTLVSSGAGEAAAAQVLADWLERAGLEVHVEEVAPGRPNVIGVARGSGGGRTLLLNGHLDTVGLLEPDGGLAARVDGGRLYGRGAYDMKGSLAAIASAGAECARRGLRGDVIVAAGRRRGGGEHRDRGSARTLARRRGDRRRADRRAPLHRPQGLARVRHRDAGPRRARLAAGSRHRRDREDGARSSSRSRRSIGRSRRGPGHPLLGTGSVHASLIEGGQEYSSYPPVPAAGRAAAPSPASAATDVEAELRGLLGDSDGSIAFPFGRDPMEVSADEEIVRTRAGRTTASNEVHGAPFWTDAALFAEAGIPAILFGPRGDGAHAAVEWVELASVERCRDLYVAVAAEFCG